MRKFISAWLIFVCSCTSPPKKEERIVRFSEVMKLDIGKSSEVDVIAAFGAPSDRIDHQDYYTLDYTDPKTGYLLLSVNFFRERRLVQAFLWIPGPQDKEFSLEGAKAVYGTAHFKLFRDEPTSHSVSETYSLIDDQAGITIRFNGIRNTVEAIARFEGGSRKPSSDQKEVTSQTLRRN